MAVIWPDVEAVLVSAAKSLFAARTEPYAAGVYISNKMPTLPNGTATRKDRMVIIRDDSGNQLDVVRDLVRIGVQFWGPPNEREEAKDLAELGRALFNSMSGTGPIKKIKCTLRPVFVEDAQPMYYCTFELIVKGSNL